MHIAVQQTTHIQYLPQKTISLRSCN